MEILTDFFDTTGFATLTWGNAIMILIGILFIFLAITKDYEPLLLVPIGMGAIVGNIPVAAGMGLSVYDEGSVLSYLYFGVSAGVYPPLIFLGIGAMTDFSTMLSNPKLVLLGAAAQIGVFLTFFGALWLGFQPTEAGAIGIIGGADGPTAIFLASKLAPNLLGAIAIAAYSYMALVPVIQPPIMKLLTSREERLIRMKPPRKVSKREKMIFPVAAFLISTMIAPGAVVLLGMLFFGNLLKESLVTERLAQTARDGDDRRRHHPARICRRCQHSGRYIPNPGFAPNFRIRGIVLCNCNCRWRAVREIYELVSHRQDQSASGGSWCFCGARLGTRCSDGGAAGRPSQFPPDARNGTQCGRGGWLSDCRWSAVVCIDLTIRF